ncbi:M56 family metallopeptidase [Pseudoduganella sp. SL102]|uniref:M56 family metallopeptidase n=1 Tax=Pseudoduganella sp. SL102 TaxID=2995154 RepID=UPI00248BD4F3|nr:M56 family metallopeptidase [Pseudoduganella sp. SL102]WBS03723.1 M56 family metallopeptidase [Pseudoduganella sp. SL102]
MITHHHQIITAIAFALLHSLWEVAVLGLFAAVSFMLLRHGAAWQRHSVGLAWMLAMCAAPLLTAVGYLRQWPAPTGGGSPGFDVPGLASTVDMGAVPSWTDWILPAMTFMWLAGVAVMLALRWGGWLFLRNIDSSAPAVLPDEWALRIEQLRAASGIARRVTVRAGSQIATPFTAYVLRPVIWLPTRLLASLPTDQLAALLAHELAHVRRLDWIWNLVQHCVESLLFYHPAMWWLSRRVREERELACDALAAQVCGDPLVLAEALASLQRERPRFPSVGLALAAQGGALRLRVAHLVQARHERACARHRGAAGLLLIAACLCCMLAATVRLPHALLINMQVRESMRGPLASGHYREFSASYLFDAQRYYRLAIDRDGHRLELYREDGVARPVDGQVRSWVAAMSAMHTGTPERASGR